MLPLSHDEVVHGKGSLIGKMPGDEWQQFANLRLLLGMQWAAPGKKLLFMGGEFGQRTEWDHESELEWPLISEEPHRGVSALVADLNDLYRKTPAMHAADTDPSGFSWIVGDDAENGVVAFLRLADGHDPVLVVANHTPSVLHDYMVGVPEPGRWVRILSTDDSRYGGSGAGTGEAESGEGSHGRPHSLTLTVPPLAVSFFTPTRGRGN